MLLGNEDYEVEKDKVTGDEQHEWRCWAPQLSGLKPEVRGAGHSLRPVFHGPDLHPQLVGKGLRQGHFENNQWCSGKMQSPRGNEESDLRNSMVINHPGQMVFS